MKKLFPKKKNAADNDTGKADLKQSINQIRMSIKKYEKDAAEFEQRARVAVSKGNMALAKNYLMRKKRAMINFERFQGFILKLERQQEAIESAETIKVMHKTMKSSTAVLQQQVAGLDLEETAELNEVSEEAIENIEEHANIMAESLSSLDDEEVTEELEAMKAEFILGGKQLPEAPTNIGYRPPWKCQYPLRW